MAQIKRFYTTPGGKKYPLREAEYDMSFKVYKSDKGRAIIGDPENCIIALGGRHNEDILYVYIGSGGDAIVVFKARPGRRAYALHFTIPAQAAKVRDSFDTKGSPATQIVMLRAPTAGRTLDARSKLNKDRNAKIKNGTHIVMPRGTPAKKRTMKLGVAHRPRARITKSGVNTQPIAV